MARFSTDTVERVKKEISLERLVAAGGIKLKRHGKDAEIICIVRSRNEPPSKSELIVLEHPSAGFLSHLSREFVTQQNDARRTTSLNTPPQRSTPAASPPVGPTSPQHAVSRWQARAR